MKKITTSDLLLADLSKLSANISTEPIIEPKPVVELDLRVKNTAMKVTFGLKEEYRNATNLVNEITNNYLIIFHHECR